MGLQKQGRREGDEFFYADLFPTPAVGVASPRSNGATEVISLLVQLALQAPRQIRPAIGYIEPVLDGQRVHLIDQSRGLPSVRPTTARHAQNLPE
jgi:hypothetical protein